MFYWFQILGDILGLLTPCAFLFLIKEIKISCVGLPWKRESETLECSVFDVYPLTLKG